MELTEDAARDCHANREKDMTLGISIAVMKQGQRPGDADRRCDRRLYDRKLQEPAGFVMPWRPVTRPDPGPGRKAISQRDQHGIADRQKAGRNAVMSPCQRPGVYQADEKEQRELSRQDLDLRLHAFGIVAVDAQQAHGRRSPRSARLFPARNHL